MADNKDDQSHTMSLPLDILITLMDYVRPLDLIAFRKTCRTLHDVSHQRTVWIKAVTELNLVNGIFLPTFQLDQLTTQELTRIATAPARWLTTMRRRCHQQAAGEQPRLELIWKPSGVNSTPIELGLEAEDEVQALFLVPGGRFAVLLTVYSLQVWDLGLVGKGSMAHRVTWVKMNQQCNITFATQPTKDGLGLRLAVSSYLVDTVTNNRKQISVYEVFLLEGRPTLNLIGRLGLDSTVDSTDQGIVPRLAGDLVFFLNDQVIQLWNFVNNHWAKWDTHKDVWVDIFMTSDSVVLLDYKETVVWKVPDLKPPNQESSVTVEQKVFSFSSLLESGTVEVDVEHCGLLCDWFWNKQEVIFDIFSRASQSESYTASRFKLASQSHSSSFSASTCPLPLFKRELAFDLDIPNPTLMYRCCEGDLVACSISETADLYVTISGEESESFVHMEMRFEHSMGSVKDYSVCPLSGRICYVTVADEIEIADLFTSIQ